MTINGDKIDLVYLWVDDSDSKWREKRDRYLDNAGKIYNSDATDKCRFANNDELKYSLRSVEQNIPWINKIYIVTDNQMPDWLNTSNEKIKMVNHSDIFPAEKLPLFNSSAIELGIPYIEGLSEYFIYANDDMLFYNPLTPDFFFEEGKPIYIAGKKIQNKKYKHLYGHMVNRMYKLVKSKFGSCPPYFPHHNADPYRKSLFLDCEKEFKEEFDNTLNSRFREFSDVQRSIVMYYSLAIGKAILKKQHNSLLDRLLRKENPDSELYDIRMKNIDKILNANSKLLCINDSRKTTDEARVALKKALETKFPNKSSFEK